MSIIEVKSIGGVLVKDSRSSSPIDPSISML